AVIALEEGLKEGVGDWGLGVGEGEPMPDPNPQPPIPNARLVEAKRKGLSDRTIAEAVGRSGDEERELRRCAGLRPAYKMVDACAAEFDAETPYFYSTYEADAEDEAGEISPRRHGDTERDGKGIGQEQSGSSPVLQANIDPSSSSPG